jgi:hypothetical protein
MAHAAGLRTNTDFQLEFFIEGTARTTDGKWALLWMQWNVLRQKVDAIPSYHLKREARRMELNWKIEHADHPWEKMIAQGDLLEHEIGNRHWEVSEAAWTDEVNFLEKRMALLDPICIYRDLPFLVRCESVQREEWCLDLMYKCENFIIATGTIPHDYLDACRLHPDFNKRILPHINALCTLRMKFEGHPAAMLQHVPRLAGNPDYAERLLSKGTLTEGDVQTVLSLRQVM